jgi:hypothetical protein
MSKTATYALIESQTLGSAQANVTFSSIPGTFTDLIVIASVGGNAANNLALRLNSDSGANYSGTGLAGNGTSPFSYKFTNETFIRCDYYIAPPSSGGFSIYTIHLQDYANTTTNKTVISRGSWGLGAAEAVVSLRRNTAAITSLTFSISNFSSNILAGSNFKLYGIQAGNA